MAGKTEMLKLEGASVLDNLALPRGTTRGDIEVGVLGTIVNGVFTPAVDDTAAETASTKGELVMCCTGPSMTTVAAVACRNSFVFRDLYVGKKAEWKKADISKIFKGRAIIANQHPRNTMTVL